MAEIDTKQLVRISPTEMTSFYKPWLKAHYVQDTTLSSEAYRSLVPAVLPDVVGCLLG